MCVYWSSWSASANDDTRGFQKIASAIATRPPKARRDDTVEVEPRFEVLNTLCLPARLMLIACPGHRWNRTSHASSGPIGQVGADYYYVVYCPGSLGGSLPSYHWGKLFFFDGGERADFRSHADDEAHYTDFEQVPL